MKSDPQAEQSEAASPAAARASEPASRSPFGRSVRTAVLVLLMAALGYVGGRIHGRVEAAAAEADLRSAVQARETELKHARSEQQRALADERAKVERALREQTHLADVVVLYEAYRVGQRALDELDARNFGMAQTRLRRAQELLLPLSARIEGVAQVTDPLSQTNIVVAGDLAQQRASVAGIVRKLDELASQARIASASGAD